MNDSSTNMKPYEVTESTIRTQKIVIFVISLSPIIYVIMGILLWSLEEGSYKEGTNQTLDILIYVFSVLTVVNIGLTAVLFNPMVKRANTYSSFFGTSLIPLILLEAIAIYGLMHLLISIFVYSFEPNFIFFLTLTTVSIIGMLYYSVKVIIPMMKKFVGKMSNEEVNESMEAMAPYKMSF